MDFLNKKFIAALGQLRQEVEALRKSIDASRDQNERQYQQEQAQRELPSPAIRVEAETHEKPDTKIKDDSYRKSTLRVQWVIAIATSAAFLAAAVYAAIAAWQTSVLRSNFRMEQRAFMKITAEPGQSLDIIPPAFWTARFTNVGKTPAFQIEGTFQFQFLKKNESPMFSYETRPYTSLNSPLMWPDDKDAIPVIRAYYPAGTHIRQDIGISPAELALFKNGEAWIAKNGRVVYEDVFGAKHVTTFCAASTVIPMDVRKSQDFPGIHVCVDYNFVDSN